MDPGTLGQRGRHVTGIDPPMPVTFDCFPIRLGNNAFEGENAAYLVDAAETTLIDTGIALPSPRAELRSGLAARDLDFADVDRVLLTHWHMDHAALAGEIQAAGGASVHVHEADAPLVGDEGDARRRRNDRTEALIAAWGMPEASRSELLAFMDSQGGAEGDPPTVTTFADGDRFDLGPVEVEAVHLPGHTAGLSGFAFDGPDGAELFSGDALLPYYTPNVGGADTRVEGPLGAYLDSLSTVVEREFARAWPGHRGPIVDPAGRAADIVAHHRHRTRRVVEFLRDSAPADPWTVSAHLFGDLESIHILHGPGEAYAHLEHLEAAGAVERTERADGAWEYDLVAEPDLEGLFPGAEGALEVELMGGH